MTTSIRDYLDELIKSLHRVAVPIDDTILRDLYMDKNYAAMLGWVKRSMRLDLRVGLRVTQQGNGKAPMWVGRPLPCRRTAPISFDARKSW